MIAGILLSMKVLAEERSKGTAVLLQTAPIQDHHIILGKFLGLFVPVADHPAHHFHMPILIQLNGKVAILNWCWVFGTSIARRRHNRHRDLCFCNQPLSTGRSHLWAGILVLGLLGWLLGKITSAPPNAVFLVSCIL